MILEVAVDSLAGALAASRAGADRIELCADLADGGTTPSAGLIRASLARVQRPVFVLVRPRAGDFLYSAEEVEEMLRDIEFAKSAGAHGIVSGALNPNGTLDDDAMDALVQASAPLPFTLHRACDMTRDIVETLDVALSLGVARMLTSGAAATALAGRERIRSLVQRALPRLTIVAGGGIRRGQVKEIVQFAGVTEVHIGPRSNRESAMRYRSDAISLHKPAPRDALGWSDVDEGEVAAVHEILTRDLA